VRGSSSAPIRRFFKVMRREVLALSCPRMRSCSRRMIKLDHVVDDVTAEERLGTLRGEVDQHMTGRVARRRRERQMSSIVRCRRPSGRVRPRRSGSRCRATRPPIAGPSFGIAVDCGEMVIVGLAEHVAAFRKRPAPSARYRAWLFQRHGPTCRCVHITMSIFFRFHPGRGEALQIRRVELVPERAMLAGFVISHTRVDQDLLAPIFDPATNGC